MTWWQWAAALAGTSDARGGDPTKLSAAEKDELWLFVNDNDPAPRVLTTPTYWWAGDTPEPRGTVSFEV